MTKGQGKCISPRSFNSSKLMLNGSCAFLFELHATPAGSPAREQSARRSTDRIAMIEFKDLTVHQQQGLACSVLRGERSRKCCTLTSNANCEAEFYGNRQLSCCIASDFYLRAFAHESLLANATGISR